MPSSLANRITTLHSRRFPSVGAYQSLIGHLIDPAKLAPAHDAGSEAGAAEEHRERYKADRHPVRPRVVARLPASDDVLRCERFGNAERTEIAEGKSRQSQQHNDKRSARARGLGKFNVKSIHIDCGQNFRPILHVPDIRLPCLDDKQPRSPIFKSDKNSLSDCRSMVWTLPNVAPVDIAPSGCRLLGRAVKLLGARHQQS